MPQGLPREGNYDLMAITDSPELYRRVQRRNGFAGASLGWMFDGFETFATVLVAPSIVNQLIGTRHGAVPADLCGRHTGNDAGRLGFRRFAFRHSSRTTSAVDAF